MELVTELAGGCAGTWVTASVICEVGRVVGRSVGTGAGVAVWVIGMVISKEGATVIPTVGMVTAGAGVAGKGVCREPGTPVTATVVSPTGEVSADAIGPDLPWFPERFADGVTEVTCGRNKTTTTQTTATTTSTATARSRRRFADCGELAEGIGVVTSTTGRAGAPQEVQNFRDGEVRGEPHFPQNR